MEEFGSHVVVAGSGFFLNNEMDDFSVKPGVPNMYGVLGAKANKVEPNKRMLSAMTPTNIVEKNGELFYGCGDTRWFHMIITSVFQNHIKCCGACGMGMQEAVDADKTCTQPVDA